MKICTHCNYENFINEDTCERCNTSISTINHEKFQFIDFIAKNWKYYTPIFGFLGLIIINQSGSLYTLLRLFFLACSIIFLMGLIKKASDYLTHLPQTDGNSRGELHIFYVFQILVICVLVYNEVKPDPHGLTTLPSFLLCLTLAGMIKLLVANRTIDKSRLMSWILVCCILSFDLFIVVFCSIFYLKDHTVIDPSVYYWAVVLTFSMFFAFMGGLLAYVLAIGLNPQSVSNIRCFEFIFEENIPRNRIILNITAGFTLLFTLVLLSMICQLIFDTLS